MRSVLVTLLLISTSALAEQNPFLPPAARQTLSEAPAGAATLGSNGQMIQPAAHVVSQEALKTATLQGAKMIAIINGEEVWFKPEEGLYVRYKADISSRSTLESQGQVSETEAIENKIADVQKAAQKPIKQAKKW